MVEFVFKSHALETEFKQLCNRVLSQFSQLPAYKLLCYIDDEVPDSLPATHGTFNGLHVPIRGSGRWPAHVEQWFYTDDYDFAFDNLIYIPRTIYLADPVAFVIILAHEFQHFVQ
jgi:hypothetical protein